MQVEDKLKHHSYLSGRTSTNEHTNQSLGTTHPGNYHSSTVHLNFKRTVFFFLVRFVVKSPEGEARQGSTCLLSQNLGG